MRNPQLISIFRESPRLCNSRYLLIAICALTTIPALAQTYKALASFDGTNGELPLAALVQGVDGGLYGTTAVGGTGHAPGGIVFKFTPRQAIVTLYDFCQTDCSTGGEPTASLVLGTDGKFYGTTELGGQAFEGTAFSISQTGAVTNLHNFGSEGTDGTDPWCTLVQGPDGELYGTAADGGLLYGTIFKITTAGKFTTLHEFESTDGENPTAGLTLGPDGEFYGVTQGGGDQNLGTIFKISSIGVFSILHNFTANEGGRAFASLLLGGDGNFYGTTSIGADFSCNPPHGCGAVFRVTPQGQLTILHTFSGPEGYNPYGQLVQATDGNFYGTTFQGGFETLCDEGCGTIFQISSSGAFAIVHNFDFTSGSNPWGGLMQATNGDLYGTTVDGGQYRNGVIYSLSMNLPPFASFIRRFGKIGQEVGILGQGFKGTTAVSFNGISATFNFRRGTFLTATVPAGATTGYVTVTAPSGTLTSNVPFYVLP